MDPEALGVGAFATSLGAGPVTVVPAPPLLTGQKAIKSAGAGPRAPRAGLSAPGMTGTAR
jgi:hypothetical protein